MAKSWRTFEHTADVGIEARADTQAELFEAMAEAFARQLCPAGVAARIDRAVRVEADDTSDLLHDFLEALLDAFDLERFLAAEVAVERIDERSVSALARGETYDPARHELGAEIKAVTYHLLTAGRDERGWIARVVLDI